MNFALRYGGNRTGAGANPHLIRSLTLTIRPTEYIRLVSNVPITCDGNIRYQSYILGWPSGQGQGPYEMGVCSRVGSIPPVSQMQKFIKDRRSTWNSGMRKAIRREFAEKQVHKHRDRVTGAWKQISTHCHRVCCSVQCGVC